MLVRLLEPLTEGDIVTDFNEGVFGKSISNGVTGLDILTLLLELPLRFEWVFNASGGGGGL